MKYLVREQRESEMKWNDIIGIGTYAVINASRGMTLIKVLEIRKRKYWHYIGECRLYQMSRPPATLCNNKEEPIIETVIQ